VQADTGVVIEALASGFGLGRSGQRDVAAIG